MSNDTAHWSIGEVLMLLQEDFPEVTISKIRFLESQGLINPERTPSGYRRFYEHDFDRLRWILTQQRDHYLPLKVIRDRLASGEPLDYSTATAPDETALDQTASDQTASDQTTSDPPAPDDSALDAFLSTPLVDLTDGAADRARTRDVAALWDELASDVAAALIDQPNAAAPEPTRSMESSAVAEPPASEPGTDPIDHQELAAAAGCDVAFLHELERFHLIRGQRVGGSVLFDPRSMDIARTAARFAEHGLDPRHLRAFRLSAEREVGLIAQVIEPGLRRRDPSARRETFEHLDSLMADARVLHAALLESVMAEQFPDHLF